MDHGKKDRVKGNRDKGNVKTSLKFDNKKKLTTLVCTYLEIRCNVIFYFFVYKNI